MKKGFICLWLLTAFLFYGCFDKDIFPDEPRIAFEDIDFFDGVNTDSLLLKFSFEDGDGNIGLFENQDVLPPFNEFLVYIDARDSVITEDNVGEAVPPIDLAPLVTQNIVPLGFSGTTLFVDPSDNDYPVFAFDSFQFSDDVSDIPFECPGLANQDGTFLSNTTLTSYVVGDNSNFIPVTGAQVITSAIPVVRNEFYYNFIIVFEKKVGESYIPLDYQSIFGTELCDIGVFNGRIPLFDREGKSGTYTYAIQSTVLRLAFLDNIIRARFYVYDRSGNQSNVVTTPDFQILNGTLSIIRN